MNGKDGRSYNTLEGCILQSTAENEARKKRERPAMWLKYIELTGGRKRMLPGVYCPHCGAWYEDDIPSISACPHCEAPMYQIQNNTEGEI